MSKPVRPEVSWTIALALGAVLVYGAYRLIGATLDLLGRIDSDMAATLLTTSTTVVVAVLSIVLGKVYEARAAEQKRVREEKVPIYEQVIAFMTAALREDDAEWEPRASAEFLSQQTPKMMLWGSDEVLAAWIAWRRTSVDRLGSEDGTRRFLQGYEKVVYAMRHDLGHRNRGLAEDDLLVALGTDVRDLSATRADYDAGQPQSGP